MIGCRTTSAYQGFSLLELSVVLAIISLIAGAGMKMASDALQGADRITTQERLNTVKLALDSFAKTYGYLPCPADRLLLASNPSFGLESRAAGNTTCTAVANSIILSGSNWSGGVPVRTLGLPDNYAGDAWGSRINYRVSVVSADPKTFTTTVSAMGVETLTTSGGGLDTISRDAPMNYSSSASPVTPLVRLTTTGTRPSGIVTVNGSVYKGSYDTNPISTYVVDLKNSVYTSADSGTVMGLGGTTSVGGVAYALISPGPDQLGSFPMTSTSGVSTTYPCPATSSYPAEAANCGDPSLIQDSDYNDSNPAGSTSVHFDDFVVWGGNELARTPDPMITSLYTSCPVATGACEPWCATCTVNYPGGGSTAPPSGFTSNAFIYKKVLTSNSTSCSATCFWGGVLTSPAGVFVKAP